MVNKRKNMLKLNPYSIGEIPNFDPCKKCLIKACCSKKCDDTLRWIIKTKKSSTIKIRIKKRRKKKC